MAAAQRNYKLPIFYGNERQYELWEIKFLGYMRLRGLIDIFSTDSVDAGKNAEAFAELLQCLDDKSLSLIIRDPRDNGKAALKILRDHYLPKGKPRIITLYTELTSLRFNTRETLTEFIVRAETLAAQPRETGETISDSLLIAMIMKALPDQCKPFVAVVNQKEDNLKFLDFKIQLRNFQDIEKLCNELAPSSVMVMKNNPNLNGVHFAKAKHTI